jgi:predicted  nucleic acid-binding Zn-ribbon protein
MKDKLIQIKLSRLIIGGILLLCFIILFLNKPTPDTVDKYADEKKEIDSLQNEIGKLKGLNHQLGNEIYLQTKVMDSLNQEIKTTEKELIQTRTYYGNKIKDLNSSSPSELNEFFTERYH